MEGGTLLQLRNLINRRNISSDIRDNFNTAVNFFELVVTGYVLAAAMHYFQLSSLKGTPTKNVISPSTNKDSWTTRKHAIPHFEKLATWSCIRAFNSEITKTINLEVSSCNWSYTIGRQA